MTKAAAPRARYLPPPVRFDTGHPVAGAITALVGFLWGLGVFAVLLEIPWQGDTLVWGAVALMVSSAAIFRELRPGAIVTLEWSVQGWHWYSSTGDGASNPVPCVPKVVLDVQRLMLVQLQDASGATFWVWCEWQNSVQWHGFRCALFAARQP